MVVPAVRLLRNTNEPSRLAPDRQWASIFRHCAIDKPGRFHRSRRAEQRATLGNVDRPLTAHPSASVDPRDVGAVLSADFGTVAGSQALFRAFLAERGDDASELSGRFGE